MDNGTRRPARRSTTPFLFSTHAFVCVNVCVADGGVYSVFSFSLSPFPSPRLPSLSSPSFPSNVSSPHVCLTSFLRELQRRLAPFPFPIRVLSGTENNFLRATLPRGGGCTPRYSRRNYTSTSSV